MLVYWWFCSVLLMFSDCLDGDHFLAGEVLLHAINAHLGKYGDGGCTLGKLDQFFFVTYMFVICNP